MTESETHETQDEPMSETSRRALLAAIGVAGAGASGYFVGTAEAATPSGEVGTPSNPYLRAYVDRMVWIGRTSDPSSPDDGTVWYRSDL